MLFEKGSSGEYLSGEGSTMRNFIVCTVYLIVRVNKSRRLRWAERVAVMGRSAFKILKRPY